MTIRTMGSALVPSALAMDDLVGQAERPTQAPNDSPPDPGLDALAQAAALGTGCAIALIVFHERGQLQCRSTFGVPMAEATQLASLCNPVNAAQGLLEITNLQADPRYAQHPMVAQAPCVRMFASMPLVIDSVVEGALCVFHDAPQTLHAHQRATLQSLSVAITEVVRSSRRLRASHHERRRLLDFARASGDWMWETDAQLRYTWVSGAFESLTGRSAESVLGQDIGDAELLDPRGAPRAGGLRFRTLLEKHQPFNRVITRKVTARGVRQISRSGVPVFADDGRFIGYRGTARDVTAFLTNEYRAHAQADLLRKLSAQVPGVIFQFSLSRQGRVHYSYVSDASFDLFGIAPPQEGREVDPDVVCRAMHPDDAQSFMRSLIQAARAVAPWQRDFRLLINGQVRWFEARAMPEPLPEGATLWHGFTSDVTARKESELALRSSEDRWSLAAEAAGIGIAHLDLRQGTVQFDARACMNHGLPYPQPRYTVDDWLESIHPDDRAMVQERLATALANLSSLECRMRIRRGDGDDATLEIFARVLGGADGTAERLVGTCRDVSQQVASEQLRAEKEMAERASRAKSEFLSRVSHELRTPLNGILGFAQLMALDRDAPLAPDQQRRLDSVQRAGRHLLELINDVLNLARIEQEDFSVQRVPVDLGHTLEACLSLIQPLAHSAQIRLPTLPMTDLWATGDPRAVEQIMINLLSNAIKYNRLGGRVDVRVTEQQGQVAVSVSDEGGGLSADQQQQLFQPFNRLGAEQRSVEGSGLGLVIARQLARAMMGDLHVHSAPAQGATFTLLLPACIPPTPMLERQATQPMDLLPAPDSTRRVLYVEDEPLNVLLLEEVFRTCPRWQLDIATTGREGLTKALHADYDLLLIDMNLPDMNGRMLLEELRAGPAAITCPCIALSADAMQPQVSAALAAGFDDYWTKPIHVPRLISDLQRVLAPR